MNSQFLSVVVRKLMATFVTVTMSAFFLSIYFLIEKGGDHPPYR